MVFSIQLQQLQGLALLLEKKGGTTHNLGLKWIQIMWSF